MKPEQRLRDLGITLPIGTPPAGNYSTAVRTGNLLFLSGKAPLAEGGAKPKGKLGREYSAEDGYRFARSACLDLLAAIRKELGSLDKVVRFVELQGSLNTAPEFEAHAEVLDGASDLLAEIFGPAGLHARSVIGVASLRNGVPLTVRAVVEISAD
jgi:enamine deaminase RidA (YjgF/YER057c/UK114 family)